MDFFNTNSYGGKSYQNHNQIGRFDVALAAVREQIDIETIPAQDRLQAEELARIIAEVMCLSPDSDVSIGKDKLPASLVSEIYGRIDSDRVRAVIRRMREISHKITHAKAYMRTALYNSVFDFEASTENEVNRAMPYLAGGGGADD